MNRHPEDVARARGYVEKWMQRFGFGQWRCEVYRLQEKYAGKVWAHGFWNTHEEHVLFEFVPDGVLPANVLEMLAIHEVAHGLFEMSRNGEAGEEVACNRLGKLLMPRAKHPNEWWKSKPDYYLGIDDATAKRLRLNPELTEREKHVIVSIYWDGRSLGELAKELDVSKTAVVSSRNRALRKLRNKLEDETE